MQMIAQFHRLLEKIAEENKKVFAGSTLRAHTINLPQKSQMAELRLVEIKARPCCNAPRYTPVRVVPRTVTSQ
jgi:hypothetical protein